MAEPYEVRPMNVASRVLAGASKRSAIQEVEQLLAEAEHVSEVSAERVQEIASRHRVDFTRRLRTPRAHLYRRFLEHCLLDGDLSEQEGDDLSHLRRILCLDDATVDRIHEDVAQAVYGEAIDQVLEDQQLDPDEDRFLRRLRSQLELREDLAKALLAEGVQRARQRFFSRASAGSGYFLVSHEAPLQLVGTSEHSIEGAVNEALQQACRAVPRLRWVELSKIRGQVVDGRVGGWQVELKTWLEPEE